MLIAVLQELCLGKMTKKITLYLITLISLTTFNFSSSDKDRDAESWTIFRGNNRLTGRVSYELKPPLKMQWEYQADSSIKSSPVVSNNKVFFGTGSGELIALDSSNGKKLWSFRSTSSIESPPLIYGNDIFFSSMDGYIFSLNIQHRTLNWKFKAEKQIVGSANFYINQEKKILVAGSYDNNLYAIDINTGKVIWNYQTDNYVNGTPTIYKDKVIFGGCDNHVHIISALTGKKVQSYDAGTYIACSIAVDKKIAYFGNYNGVFTALDINKGEVIWKYEDSDMGPFISSASVDDNVVIAGSRDNNLYCFDKFSGKVKWVFETGDAIDSSPVISKTNVLSASKDGFIYVIDINTGNIIWSYDCCSEINTSPAVTDQGFFIGTDNGKLYHFRFSSKKCG